MIINQLRTCIFLATIVALLATITTPELGSEFIALIWVLAAIACYFGVFNRKDQS